MGMTGSLRDAGGLLIGESRPFQAALDQMSRFAECSAPVLLEGETGTGKELAARTIHGQSDRSAGPFVPLNMAALPEALLINELFGHEAGAYTGAQRSSGGLVQEAEGGTIFLDEIDSMPLSVQATLLRFLEDQEYRPLGAGAARQADVRVISATNADMTELVRAHRFREDLFYRVNVLHLRLPPLRARLGDLEPLAASFLERLRQRYGGATRRIAPDAWAVMRRHSWPGNVRELENRIHRGFLMAQGADIGVVDLDLGHVAAETSAEPAEATSFTAAKARVVAEFERAYIERVLSETHGNLSAASRLANKERRSFARLVVKYGIDRKDFAPPQP